MGKLRHRQHGGPFLRFVQGEQPEIGFQFLIHLLHFSISWRVICCGQCEVILEKSCQFSGKGRGELGSAIRYDLGV